METARRLGIYSLILAFLLFVFFDQTETSQLEWRNQLLAYGIIFAFLGLFLITRFRSRPERSSRFSWLKNWLFKSSKNKKNNRMSIRSRQNNRSGSGKNNEDEEEESRRN